jgi:hypothetical protein
MDIKIRTAKQINAELYKEMLNDIKVIDTKRIINEGQIDYQCDYYTIYYHEGSKCVGLHNVVHCSCYGTDDDEPLNFGEDEDMLIVDTIEDFYKKCIYNTLEYTEVRDSYIDWFEENFFNETERYKLILDRKQEQDKIKQEQDKIKQEQEEQQAKEKEEQIIISGICCCVCQNKNLKEDMYQTKNGFECKFH